MKASWEGSPWLLDVLALLCDYVLLRISGITSPCPEPKLLFLKCVFTFLVLRIQLTELSVRAPVHTEAA